MVLFNCDLLAADRSQTCPAARLRRRTSTKLSCLRLCLVFRVVSSRHLRTEHEPNPMFNKLPNLNLWPYTLLIPFRLKPQWPPRPSASSEKKDPAQRKGNWVLKIGGHETPSRIGPQLPSRSNCLQCSDTRFPSSSRHTGTQAHRRTRAHAHRRTRAHAHTRTRTRTHTHTHTPTLTIHTHTHTHTLSLSLSLYIYIYICMYTHTKYIVKMVYLRIRWFHP